MVFSAWKKYIGIFCFLRPCVYHATNMHFKSCIFYFLFVSNINTYITYKCHIINFLLTSLARNIGPRSFCTNLVLYAGSVYTVCGRLADRHLADRH
jgi:hypothetical protein